MLADSFIWVINKGIYDGVYYESTDILQSILRWGQNISYVVFAMAIFFKSRLFKNIAIFICLPFSILNTIYFSDFMAYFMGDVLGTVGRGIQTSYLFRSIYFSVELGISLLIPITFMLIDRHFFNFKDKTEWKKRWRNCVKRCSLLFLPPRTRKNRRSQWQIDSETFLPYHRNGQRKIFS